MSGEGEYCPTLRVTRGQMAAFLTRMGDKYVTGLDFAAIVTEAPDVHTERSQRSLQARPQRR